MLHIRRGLGFAPDETEILPPAPARAQRALPARAAPAGCQSRREPATTPPGSRQPTPDRVTLSGKPCVCSPRIPPQRIRRRAGSAGSFLASAGHGGGSWNSDGASQGIRGRAGPAGRQRRGDGRHQAQDASRGGECDPSLHGDASFLPKPHLRFAVRAAGRSSSPWARRGSPPPRPSSLRSRPARTGCGPCWAHRTARARSRCDPSFPPSCRRPRSPA